MFTHGVASGDPTDSSVVIWTRPDEAGSVEWRVARDPQLVDVVAIGVVEARPERDLCVSIDVEGLEPGTTYWYGFSLGATESQQSPLGRTRTLPGPGAERLRFAFTSCAKYNAGFFNAYDRIADRTDLDLVVHLGDYVYEASNTPPASQTPGADIGRPFDPSHECVSLADYRTRYAQYHRDPALQRLRAAHPIVTCIDDHELADGAWRAGASEHQPQYGEWDSRLSSALQAREEWLPLRRPDPGDPTRVYRRISVGELVDLILLDTRSRRDQPQPSAERPEDSSRSALGAEQRTWFMSEMRASTASWRLVGNPSILSTTWHPELPGDLHEALSKLKLIGPVDTGGPDFDQWDGYPSERVALLDVFDELDDVVVLSGDIHVGLVAEVRRDPWSPGDPIAIELVSPSVTSQNLDDKLGYARGGSAALSERFIATHPHVKWAEFDSHGYVVVDVDHERLRATWWAVDDVLTPSEGEEQMAAFTVRRGLREVLPLSPAEEPDI